MPSVLHHIELGMPDAPPLVLLHGFMGRAEDWSDVVASLAGDFRCIMIDLPGHGRSTGLPAATYRWEGALDALATTLDELGIERCRMIGYSMGGRIAVGFALAHRRRLARLVLVGASPGIRRAEARLRRIELDEERAAALAADLPAFVRIWYRMPLFDSLDDHRHLREELAAHPGVNGSRSRLRNDSVELATALSGLSTGRMPSYWDRLDDLGAPTLAVAGERDPKFVDLAFRMAGAGLPVIPVVIPDAGHLVHLERSDHLAQVTREFCGDSFRRREGDPAISQAA